MSAARYAGSYRSAIARARRIVIAAGLPWGKITGRYSPFGDTQTITSGIRVQRVGCGDSIAVGSIHASRHWSATVQRETRELEARAITVLRAAGMPFDDRGWLLCARERS